MDKRINGVFKSKFQDRQEELPKVWLKMLDKWMDVLEDEDRSEKDGAAILKKILKDCGHDWLGSKLKLKSNNDNLPSKIPISHPDVPDLIRDQSKTAKPPSVDMQGPMPTCASRAVAKAIQAHFDDMGCETIQEEIANALLMEVQNDGKAKNPDEFDAEKITKKITKRRTFSNTVSANWKIIYDLALYCYIIL